MDSKYADFDKWMIEERDKCAQMKEQHKHLAGIAQQRQEDLRKAQAEMKAIDKLRQKKREQQLENQRLAEEALKPTKEEEAQKAAAWNIGLSTAVTAGACMCVIGVPFAF
jgi:hypothetical protein